MRVIIRDDDISYFSKPVMLESIYKKCWKNEIPISLSVIPLHDTDTESQVIDYEPNIPSYFRNTKNKFDINRNKRLCRFLEKRVKKGLVEISLHGFTHQFRNNAGEFCIDNKNIIGKNLIAGKLLLKKAVPSSEINTFIPPFDSISKNAIDVVIDNGFNICTSRDNFQRKFRYKLKPFYIKKSKIFLADDYLFNPILSKKSPKECFDFAKSKFNALYNRNLPFICVNHYWEFYNGWKSINKKLIRYWNLFIEYILSKGNISFTTFNNFVV